MPLLMLSYPATGCLRELCVWGIYDALGLTVPHGLMPGAYRDRPAAAGPVHSCGECAIKNDGAQGGGGAPPFIATSGSREETTRMYLVRYYPVFRCGDIREEEDATA